MKFDFDLNSKYIDEGDDNLHLNAEEDKYVIELNEADI